MNIFCCVPKCNMNMNPIVHRFPDDLELFKIWTESMKNTDITFERRDMFRVCDSHFSQEMKFLSCENKIFLKKGAYPDTILEIDDMKLETVPIPKANDDIEDTSITKENKELQNPSNLSSNGIMCTLETDLVGRRPDFAQPSTSRENLTTSRTDGLNRGNDKKNNEEVVKKLGIIISGQLQTTRGQLKKAKKVFELKCELYKEKLNFVKLKKEKFLVEHILKIKLLRKQLAVEERRLQRNCVRCRRLRH